MGIADRFWAKVRRAGPDDCWEFTGYRNRQGYGRIKRNGRIAPASWVALELDGQVRPTSEHCALHSCDNPPCCNPAHLRWGTQVENRRDAMLRGRASVSGLTGGGIEKWRTRLVLQANARKLAARVDCPACGALAGVKCRRLGGQRPGMVQPNLHHERIAMVTPMEASAINPDLTEWKWGDE